MNIISLVRMLSIWLFLSTCCVVWGGNKRFVFRLQDIQDSYNSRTQVALIDFFMTNKIAFDMGIIGGYFTGMDVPLYTKIKTCLALGSYKCGLFNQGMDAKYLFRNASSVESAKAEVKACDDRIRSLFSDYRAEVMVPYMNSWGPHLITALQQLGYLGISASSESYSNMTWSITSRPIQIPQQTATATYYANNKFGVVPISVTTARCEAADKRGEDCVIMIQPKEFADGLYTFNMLRQLINTLYSKGWTSINFHQIIEEASGQSETPTIQPTMSMLHMDSFLTLTNVAEPILPSTGRTIVKDSYDMILPYPMVASPNMSIVSQTQDSHTNQWQIVIQSFLTIPMDGRTNATNLFGFVKTLLNTAVTNHLMTHHLRSRSIQYGFTSYVNSSIASIGYTNTFVSNGEKTTVQSGLLSNVYVIIALVVAGLVGITVVVSLSIFICRHKHTGKAGKDDDDGGSTWWTFPTDLMSMNYVLEVVAEDVSPLSSLRILDMEMNDADTIIIDTSPCEEKAFVENAFAFPSEDAIDGLLMLDHMSGEGYSEKEEEAEESSDDCSPMSLMIVSHEELEEHESNGNENEQDGNSIFNPVQRAETTEAVT